MRHQELEQPVLDAAQVEQPAARGYAVGRRIEHQLVALERRLPALVVTHAQDGADARDDFAQRERLANIVVDPEIEPRDDILLGGERRQYDEPDGGRAGNPASLLDQVHGEGSRHVPIEDDQMRRPFRHCRNRRSTVRDRAHHESRFRELLTQWLDCSNIPIDDQNLFGFCDGHRRRDIREIQLYINLTVL